MTLRPCIVCGRPTAGSRCPDPQRPSVPRHRSYRDQRNRLIAATTTCYLCGQPLDNGDAVELDHIIGRAQGGGHDVGNLAPVHRRCHTTKDATMGETPLGAGGQSRTRTPRGHPANSAPERVDPVFL